MQTNPSIHAAPAWHPRSVGGLVVEGLVALALSPFALVIGSWWTYHYLGNYCFLVGGAAFVVTVIWAVVALSRASTLHRALRPQINETATF